MNRILVLLSLLAATLYSQGQAEIDTTGMAKYKYSKACADSLQEGELALDFTGTDPNGNKISLSQFKGKYVYIDFWTTWCGPCVKETPYFEKLKEKYKDKNIAFLSVSLDDNRKKWERYVKKKGMTAHQLFAGGRKVPPIHYYCLIERDHKYYVSIPRFVLIGKEGEIIKANAPRPSMTEEINKLLGSL